MPFTTLSANVFWGESVCAKEGAVVGDNGLRKFRGVYGVTPTICEQVWSMLLTKLPKACRPKHLLWSLLFLKNYNCESTNAAFVRTNEKTFRKWVWLFVRLISELEVIKWNNRLLGREESIYKVSVDGKNFRIYEPAPFHPKWYSHKFHGLGLRYEVGVAIASGWIVWVHGPYRCDAFLDVKIFRLRMKQRLLPAEKVVADGGYQDERCSSSSSKPLLKYWSFVRERHEALNKRLKQFNILKHRYRHEKSKHGLCFFAVANLTQLLIEGGEPIFQK